MKYALIILSFTFLFVSTDSKAQSDSSATKSETFKGEGLQSDTRAKDYGFSSKNPVLVGGGLSGGARAQRAYLERLRDGKGKTIKYKRLGSCCPYPSENGMFGGALIDRYEIQYRNKNGKKKKEVVYISFYDYEKPRPLPGFTFIE